VPARHAWICSDADWCERRRSGEDGEGEDAEGEDGEGEAADA